MSNIDIYMPNGEVGFVEKWRNFTVEGNFNVEVPDNAKLRVNLLDENNNIVRFIETDKKNKPFLTDYPKLVMYKEELDPGRKKMLEFGYPILCVKDINNPDASFHNATIKLWFDDKKFKGVFINATDVAHGAAFDDGLNFVDENGNPYSELKEGFYTIEVILFTDEKVIEKTYKKIKYGKRDKQLICRFNPYSHRMKMAEWCKDKNIAIVIDLLPGYLEPYLGKWFYHMGLMKTYHANDMCLYNGIDIVMVVYLIDPTSTSYETELSLVQTLGRVNDDHLQAWHYDIGEAEIKGLKGNLVPFNKDEYMSILRVDTVNDQAKENVYYIDARQVDKCQTDIKNITIQCGDKIQIMGVLKPWQMDKEDFILRDDYTYEVKNYPDIIHYEFDIDGKTYSEDRKLLLERIDQYPLGSSVFEFYNLFDVKPEWKDKMIHVHVSCIDKKGNLTKACADFSMKVK